MHILFCTCRLYHHLDSRALAALAANCRRHGHQVTVVPDLCRLAARPQPQLPGGCDRIVACHPRAIHAMFPDFPAACVINLRTGSIHEAADALGVTFDQDTAPTTPPPPPEAPEHDEWIPWFPVIDQQRCVNCGKCLDFCMFGVYSKDGSGKILVTAPASCKTDCPACARMCPRQAIIFPKSKEEPINGAEPPPPAAAAAAAGDPRGLLARLKSRHASRPTTPPLFKDDPQ